MLRVVVFAEQFQLAHDAYETFMESIGYPFAPLIRKSEYLLPDSLMPKRIS